MKRFGTAVWSGNLKGGTGVLTTPSKVLHETPYSFASRFEEGGGTNPEELIAAAHAGCFSMAFSAQLEAAGFKAERIETTATLTMEKTDAGFTITSMHLQVKAKVPGIPDEKFMETARSAETGCPVSRLINAYISMDAQRMN